jgi:Leucine-rich repeat (LRR) protein
MILQDWLDINYTKQEQIKLTTLNCFNNKLTSLKGIENLINLTYLSCSHNKLTSLKGIELLVNLKILYCDNNQLTSLKEIENLINLTYLNCSDNQLSYKSSNLKGILKEIKIEKRKNIISNLLNEYI